MSALGMDGTVYAYVGFNGGLLRKIDIQNYEIVLEQSFVFRSDLLPATTETDCII